MKLQQKLESSLDDIIKTTKKDPSVSKKSKGITRTGSDKLKRLKQLNRNKSKPGKDNENRHKRGGPAGQKFSKKPQKTGKDNDHKPFKKGQVKWTGPKRGSRFRKNFRGRSRN